MRTVRRVVPVLERLGLETMRLPDPGRGKRVTLDGLLRETPGLAVLVDTDEQPVQRHTERDEADRWYSGKKKRHTIKTQVAVDERDGRIRRCGAERAGADGGSDAAEGIGVAAAPAAGGGNPRRSRVRRGGWNLPRYAGGDAASQATGQAAPGGGRGRQRGVRTAGGGVEHTIGRLRCYESVTQRDRYHRRGITARNRAVAGLVNRRMTR